MKIRCSGLFIAISCLLSCCGGYAQDGWKDGQVMTLPQAFTLALKNSVQLKISATEVGLAHQSVGIYRLGQLPGISSGLDYGYISNSDIWNGSFSQHQIGPIPHKYTSLTVQAGEEIFKGGEVRNNIRKATIEEQIAVLSLEKNTEDIKFLVAGEYLDIYKLINLRQVYINNAGLAETRLKNIVAMQKQGMVTENDVLRTELTLSGLRLSIRKTGNSIEILTKQMNVILGLDNTVPLIPDTTILAIPTANSPVDSFLVAGYGSNHDLKINSRKVMTAETNVKLLESERYPSITAFAGTNMQRPFIYSIPAVDIYYNIWQVGLSVRYNISSIYQSPRKIRAGKIQLEETRQYETLQRQNQEVDVRARYIKFKEAEDELTTANSDLRSAQENYRIVEKKYYSQLALIADLVDATNTKIEAETKVVDSEINRVYAYYLLLKASVGSIGI
jgi:outer membrane protein